jgi:hypothetical protein
MNRIYRIGPCGVAEVEKADGETSALPAEATLRGAVV